MGEGMVEGPVEDEHPTLRCRERNTVGGRRNLGNIKSASLMLVFDIVALFYR